MILSPFGGVKNTKKNLPSDFRLFNNRKEIFFFLTIILKFGGGAQNVGIAQMGENAFSNKLIPKENPMF